MKKGEMFFKKLLKAIPLLLVFVGGLFFINQAQATVPAEDQQINFEKHIDMGTKKIINLGTPEEDTDAVTKDYVDGAFTPGGTSVIWDCATKDGNACASGENNISLLYDTWNVGIGTVPGEGIKLDVEGNIEVSGAVTAGDFVCADCLGLPQIDDIYVQKAGDTMSGPLVMNSTYINLNRNGATDTGIQWYNSSYNAWANYMGPAGSAGGPKGNLTIPSGDLVTSWGLRSFIEGSGGYGWTFESGSSSATTPNIVAEIRSSDGLAQFDGGVRSPVFYDLNNIAYYANPAGTSKFNTLNAVSWEDTAVITNLNADLLDGQQGSYYATANEVTNLGAVVFNQAETTTDAFIAKLEDLGAFDNFHSIMKATWNYSGNTDISDTGFGTFELAGCVVETWTDNASDTTRGNIHVRVTRPTTGPGESQILVYNDQGSTYSPGWRQVWTSNTDGPNSGLNADLLDGVSSGSFLRSDTSDYLTSGSLYLGGGTTYSVQSDGDADLRYVGILTNPSSTYPLYVNGNAYLAGTTYMGTTSYYVDTSGNANFLSLAAPIINGGTGSFTGTVSGATPTAGNHFVTKDYVDAISDDDVKVAVDAGATADYIGASSGVGVLRTSSPLSYADGGNYITLGITSNSIGDAHLAYNTGQHLTTSATPQFARLGLGAVADSTYLFNLNGTKMHGTSTGIGIGTTIPAAKLDIRGGNLALDPAHNAFVTDIATPTSSDTYYAANVAYVDAAINGVMDDLLPTGNPGDTLRHDGTAWVNNNFLYNDGSFVGIGLGTVAPAATLDVGGSMQATDIVATETIQASVGTISGQLYVGSGNVGEILDVNAGIYARKGIGVGIPSPSSGVHIKNDAGLKVEASANTYAGSLSTTGPTSGLVLSAESDMPLVFKTNNTEKVRILGGATPFVGIGTSSPQATLHVNGFVRGNYLTPTDDYHFATKNYVDDKIEDIGGGADGYIGDASPSPHVAGAPLDMNAKAISGVTTLVTSGNVNVGGDLDVAGGGITSANRVKSDADAVFPYIYLDSSSSGDNWTSQGAHISIGEGGDLGAASLHMTYIGNGYGYIGSGAVSNGVPGASYLRFDYDSSNIYSPDVLTLGNDLFVNDFARIDALRVGNTSADPGDKNIYVEGDATVLGKLTAAEIDPPYSIDGTIYATYGHSTTGLKEETVGKVELVNQVLGHSGKHGLYYYAIDFDEAEKESDLWLFKEITAFGDNWNNLVVILTPEGRADVWYELIPEENRLIVYGERGRSETGTGTFGASLQDSPLKVSYRLIAPRFDWSERDTNLYNQTGEAPEGVGVFVR
jgi:hypothetical protein